MRTIRDNYYVITGHTYEEYIKKYRHEIGKGKLLQFGEDETKYLRKNKHYWEVQGPDGKTLYCEIGATRKDSITALIVIAALVGGGTATGILLPRYLNRDTFDGIVTAEEWKESFENIVRINKKNTLNYTAEGYMNITETDKSTIIFRDLLVDGDLEQARYEQTISETKYNGKVYLYQYKQIPLLCVDSEKAQVRSTMLKDYVAQLYGQLNTQQDSFTFNAKNKSYFYEAQDVKEESYTLKYVKTEIKYGSDKKIHAIACNYELTNGFKYESNLSYTYGNVKLDAWENDKEFKEAAEKITYNLIENADGNWVTEAGKLPNVGETFIATNDSANTYTVDGINTIRLINGDGQACVEWAQNDAIYVDGELLIRNQGFKYIFKNEKMVGMRIINRTLTHENKITLKTALYQTSEGRGPTINNPQLVFSAEANN